MQLNRLDKRSADISVRVYVIKSSNTRDFFLAHLPLARIFQPFSVRARPAKGPLPG